MTLDALLTRTLALFAFGALLMALGTVRQPTAVRRARVLKLLVFFAIVHGVIALAVAGRVGIVGLALAILAVAAWEGVRAWRRMAAPRPIELPLFVLTAGAGFLVASVRLPPFAVAWIFLCAGAFDGFSQVIGQWLGRHLLVPRISPTKTLEGLLGGLVGAALVAVWLRSLAGYGAANAALLGVGIALASVAGDLVGSWAKRRAGIKDFSDLLPGQGGVIDRFSSFLVAMAVVGLWL